MTVFVTGGAGFIGSTLIKYFLSETEYNIVNIDKLNYAGNLASLKSIAESSRYRFVKADINDTHLLRKLFEYHQPCAVFHLAAETHVDRSISAPFAFLEANTKGTFSVLEASRNYLDGLNINDRSLFRFHHVSTDEVYGELGVSDEEHCELTRYNPSSPYAASKASSDHLVRAWGRTYGIPVIVSNCSNNYGPFQYPEKLIPLVIINAIKEIELPIFGKGTQVRDWIFVEDHVSALIKIFENGKIGHSYNIGSSDQRANIEVVEIICDLLDEMSPTKLKQASCHRDLITFVPDRPGHDMRYAIDATKLRTELNWEPNETLICGLRKTVKWYLENESWWERTQSD